MNKRVIVQKAIEAGGATKESLMEAAEVNDKGLASLLTYLRWGGICPIKGEDGVYKLITEEEWEAHKASRVGAGATASLTPEQRLEKATKRTTRAASALDKAKERFDAHPDDKLIDLQHDKAGIELQISELLEGRADADAKANPTPEVPEDISNKGEKETITSEDIGNLDEAFEPNEDEKTALDNFEKEFDGNNEDEDEDEFL